MSVDDDQTGIDSTRADPSSPPLPTTELSPPAARDTPLAYSVDTASAQVVDYQSPRSRDWWRVAALIAAILVVTGGAAAAILWLGGRSASTEPTVAAVPVQSEPRDPADAAFISDLRASQFPIDDWQYLTNLARSACGTITRNSGYPPGPHTIGLLRGDVGGVHSEWTYAQLYRFTVATVDAYCPAMWGPTQEEIDALPREDRYLKTLETELGITMTTRDAALRTADQVCTGVHQGKSIDVLVDEFIQAARPAEWKQDDALAYLQVTRDVYCNEKE